MIRYSGNLYILKKFCFSVKRDNVAIIYFRKTEGWSHYCAWIIAPAGFLVKTDCILDEVSVDQSWARSIVSSKTIILSIISLLWRTKHKFSSKQMSDL